MAVTGKTVRTKALSTKSGRSVTVSVIRPEPTLDNIRELRRVSDRWDDDAELIRDEQQQHRAYFAGYVAFEAAVKLLVQLDGNEGCCVLVAQDERGEVLGVATYRPEADGISWYLENLALAPRQQHNPLNADPIRGIGTSLLGVIAQDVCDGACHRLWLRTLDQKAEQFWKGRGFHNTTEPLHLEAREVAALKEELSHSHPDRPDEDDIPFALVLERWRAVEKPAIAAKIF